MTTATSQSITVLELLGTNVPEGQKAKVVTDNDLYGTTVIKSNGSLINMRTNKPLALTVDLLQTKFRLTNDEKRVSLGAFLEAYKVGKKVKVALEDRYRFIQKEGNDMPEEIRSIMELFTVQEVDENEVMTMEELTKGTYYIVE